MALRDINLLPDSFVLRRKSFRHGVLWATATLLCLVLVTVGGVFYVRNVDKGQRPGQSITDVRREYAGTMAAIEDMRSQLNALFFVDSVTGTRAYSDLMVKLSEIMGAGIWATELTLEQDPTAGTGVLSVNGFAISNAELSSFLNELDSEPMFQNAVLEFSRPVSSADKQYGVPLPEQLFSYQVECELVLNEA